MLASCASTKGGGTESGAAESAATSPDQQAAADAAKATAGASEAQTDAIAEKIEAQAEKDAEKSKPDIPDMAEAPQIVDECKKEAYVSEDKKARASIKKGKEAMEAGIYGVGFKNVDNYKQWSTMHNTVFTGVSRACAGLSDCAKKHAKAKDKLCAEQARIYADWKHTAKEFADKVKSVETTQPPQLCSSPLSKNDPSYCYQKLAEKIEKVCTSDDCQEASQCWRSVTILDGAVNQEESACRFMRIKLSHCNGYKEATHRREAAFKRCNYLQDKADIKVAPVL